jgi:ribosome maturation factor RimP
MKPAAWIDKVYEIVDRAGRKDGIEAVEVHWLGGGKNRLLRIYIDKPEGVTHGDCEMVSQYVGTVLDAEDLVPANVSYTLEVSSPGVERKLSKPKDFERFAGQKVKIVLREPLAIEDKRTFWEGTLAGFKEGVITLQPAKGEPAAIPLEKVERANLKFEW